MHARKIIRVILPLLLIISLLLGCGKAPEVATEPTAQATEASEPTQILPVTEPEDGLSVLRGDMDQALFAIADFGFPELSAEFEIMDYLLDEYPNWMEHNSFIQKIPDERVIRDCSYEDWGNLLCIVPKDPMATVCVNAVLYTETEPYEELDTEVLYRSESGEPVLVLADIAENRRITIAVTDNSGKSVTFSPYWDSAYEDAFSETVMDFSPISEKTAHDNALDYGWRVPDASFLTDHHWHSYNGYELKLVYHPDGVYDGEAWIYENDGTGVYTANYQGGWKYADGILHLDLKHNRDNSLVIQGDFPILLDPFDGTYLGIFRTAEGIGLPQFGDFEYDELEDIDGARELAYSYALSQGWRVPELGELMGTNWLSVGSYAMDLQDDSVPNDNGGNVVIYDVDEIGTYTESYIGSWQYGDGMLHLSLIPEFDDGYLVDASFPVLILDEELWIGSNENGVGLPHFYDNQLNDILVQPKG